MARTVRRDLDHDIVFICTNKRCGVFWTIVGLCLTIGGIIGLIVAPIATKQQASTSIPLTEKSFAATQWIDPPYIVTMQLWIFNTTNVAELLRGTEKPSVAEKGPYTFKQINQKNQVIYGDNDNVSYIATNTFFFDPDRSCSDCLLTDMFTVPNAVYTTVTQRLRFQSDDVKRLANLALMALSEGPFVTKTAAELLFSGFEDEILIVANGLKFFVPKLAKVDIPKVFQYFPKNNTNDGRYEVCVGNSDVKKMGSILTWNGQTELKYWSGEANKIQGTDAQIFPPFINRGDKLPIFVSDMCRSAYLTYQFDLHDQGMQVYRFTLPGEVFNTSNPNNKGFCLKTDKYFPSQSADANSCLPAGFLNLTTCRGAPILMSKPHFLDAADEVIKSVDGIHPSDDHQPLWNIEPVFGAATAVMVKLQLNVPIYPDPLFWNIKLAKPSIVPLFWFNASAMADVGTADYLYNNVVVLQTIGYAATFAVLLIGLIILFTLLACCCRRRHRETSARWTTTAEAGHVNRALIEEAPGPSGYRKH